MPWTTKVAGDTCVIRPVHTDAINHEPANPLDRTGSMQAGVASFGSWIACRWAAHAEITGRRRPGTFANAAGPGSGPRPPI